MKKLLLIVGVAVGACLAALADVTHVASYQDATAFSVTNGTGVNINNVVTTNAYEPLTNAVYLDFSGQKDAALELGVFGGTSTSNSTIWLAPSLGDGYARRDTNSTHLYVITYPQAGGAITNWSVTNIGNIGAIQGFYVQAASNASWTVMATNFLRQSIKTQAP